jgi:hypothetical protein
MTRANPAALRDATPLTLSQWISTLGKSTLTLMMKTFSWRQNCMTLTLVDPNESWRTPKQKLPQ